MATKWRAAVVVGRTRPNRRSGAVAEWVCADPPSVLELVVIDLAEVDLPLQAEPSPAAFGAYLLPSTCQWSELIDGFDAVVLVSPEYNTRPAPFSRTRSITYTRNGVTSQSPSSATASKAVSVLSSTSAWSHPSWVWRG